MSKIDILLDFISASPTSYHAVATTAGILDEAGFTALDEADEWALEDGGAYYTVRGGSLIAFKHRADAKSFCIVSAHTDSPALKIKSEPESRGIYTKANVECYGGALNYTWFDRPLSIAGRVFVKCEGGIEERLVALAEPSLVIPSVAPHLNRAVNSSFAPNPAVDLQPLFSLGKDASVTAKVAEALGVNASDIVSGDLFVYNADKGAIVGADSELVIAPRIDDLASVFCGIVAMLGAEDTSSTPVLALFDNEEVGSSTKEGAAADFLYETVSRLSSSDAAYRRAIRSSLMLSVDGAHAIHPNHPELSDPACHPILGGGVVVKYNANRRYATDAESAGILAVIAEGAGVKLQSYANRADIPGGSTLGSIATTRLPVSTVDIGLPQLAMHSIAETAAVSDIDSMIALLRAFYETELKSEGARLIVK